MMLDIRNQVTGIRNNLHIHAVIQQIAVIYTIYMNAPRHTLRQKSHYFRQGTTKPGDIRHDHLVALFHSVHYPE